ncbi:hypothetical protein FOZ62_031810, partial [Perkinsus olseni]
AVHLAVVATSAAATNSNNAKYNNNNNNNNIKDKHDDDDKGRKDNNAIPLLIQRALDDLQGGKESVDVDDDGGVNLSFSSLSSSRPVRHDDVMNDSTHPRLTALDQSSNNQQQRDNDNDYDDDDDIFYYMMSTKSTNDTKNRMVKMSISHLPLVPSEARSYVTREITSRRTTDAGGVLSSLSDAEFWYDVYVNSVTSINTAEGGDNTTTTTTTTSSLRNNNLLEW